MTSGPPRIPRLRDGGEMESREECLREAAECDRLAKLANTQGTRTLLAVAAFQWQKLAERAAERQKRSWPLMPEARQDSIAVTLTAALTE